MDNKVKKYFNNKLFKETFWSFSTKGISFILYVSLNIYLARSLGIEQFGAWSFFFSFLTIIFLITNFGINQSSRKFIAQYSGTDKINCIIRSSFRLRFIVSTFFILILFFLSEQIGNLLNKEYFNELLPYSLILIFFYGGLELTKSIFSGLHVIKNIFFINVLEFGLKLLLVITFFSFAKELLQLQIILLSFTIATFVAFIYGYVALRRKYFNEYGNNEIPKYMKSIFLYSLPLLFIGFGFSIFSEIDTFMIGLMKNDKEVGAYTIAKQIITQIPHISIAISMGTMPIFAKLNKNNSQKLKIFFYKLLKINFIIMFSIVVVIILFSHIFIPFIYGEQFHKSILPLMFLTFYLICFSTTVFLSVFLDYQGLAKKRMINLIFSIIANIILNYLLIPKYGATGAAMATSISYFPYFVLNYLEVRKFFKRLEFMPLSKNS